MSIFRDGLPHSSAELIERLNKEITPATVRNTGQLSDDAQLFELARQMGERDLVDRLVYAMNREKESP